MAQFTGRLLTSLARWAMFAFAIVVPLVYFPWTVDPLEINKQTVAVIAAIVLAVAWLGSMFIEKRAEVRALWVAVPAMVFLVGAAISTAFSVAPYASAIGQASQEYTSLLTIGVGVVMLIAGAHVMTDRAAQRRLWAAGLMTSAVVGVAAVLPFFKLTGWNLVGTPNALALYLLAMSLLGAGLWLASRGDGARDMLPAGAWGVVTRGAVLVTSLATLLILLAIDFWVLWVAGLVGTCVLFTFALARAQEFPHPGKFILPMLVFVVGLLFLALPTVLRNPYASEIAPTFALTWEVTRGGLADHGAFFGSGPGTFVVNYSAHQPIALNTTDFWDTHFDRGASHALTMLGTLGLIPTLAFLAFVLSLGVLSVLRLIRERDHDEWKLTFAPFVAWVVLVFGMVFYAQNMTLVVLFWLVSTVLAGHTAAGVKMYAFSRSPRAGLLSAFCFVLAAVGMLTVLFVTVTRYQAEIAYARAVTLDRNNGAIDDVIAELDRAATSNRWSDVYYRNLGNALLYKTNEVLADPSADPEFVKALIGAAVNAANRATDLGPSNVVNWELRGDIYREVTPVVADADTFAVEAYTTASKLAPTNPKFAVGIARTYLAKVDVLRPIAEGDDAELAADAAAQITDLLVDAKAELGKALGLKDDYVTAQYFMAFVLERQGEIDEAVRSMELVRATNPSDVGVGFQLALLYMRQEKNDLARTELERIIALAPKFSNARWYLSALLAQEGETEKAIAELESLQTLHPDNATIAQRLEELRAGETAIPDPLEEDDATVLPDETTPPTTP